MNARRWNGLVIGLMGAIAMHVSAAPQANRNDEPWPALLSGESVSVEPDVAALQQRAHGSMDRLMQAARTADERQNRREVF